MAFRTVYVVRHSQSVDNEHHVFSGWRDSPLTNQGIETAKILAQKLKHKQIDLSFSSDQVRALDTAKEILEFHKETPIIVDARLRERDYGALTGQSKIAFQLKNPKLYEVYHRSFNKGPPKGESFKAVDKRVQPFIKDLISIVKEMKVNVLIAAHGNSIRPIRKHFEHLSIHQMRTIDNPHEKIFEYKIKV